MHINLRLNNISNPYLSFNKKNKKNKDIEKATIGYINDYLNYKISKKELETFLMGVENQAKSTSCKLPQWYKEISSILSETDEDNEEAFARYEIMKFLQNLKNNNQYRDIIQQDYSPYLNHHKGPSRSH